MQDPQGTRRVLLVDQDPLLVEQATSALRAAGMEVTAVGDARSGLRKLASLEPDVLFLELVMPELDGTWLLRRLRDEYMGARPRVVVVTRAESVTPGLAELGVDAVILKPTSGSVLAQVAGEGGPFSERGNEPELVRELVKLSILSSDIDQAFSTLAERLALVASTSNCVVVGAVGERQVIGSAHGPVDESPEALIWDRCRIALDCGTPVLMPAIGSRVDTYLAVPIESAGGTRLGVLMLYDEGPRLFHAEVVDNLRALGHRLYAEMAWRSVHERIAQDRDRLRETSLLDPLVGIWTRAALDQALPGEVSACQRRGEPMSVAVLDVRHLKHVNERYGHVVGDAILRHVAAIVRQALRTQDKVARYAGDSMALVLAGTPIGDAQRVVERLQEQVAGTPFDHDGVPITARVTAGLSHLAGDDDTGEGALARAAAAVVVAKRRDEPLAVADATAGDKLELTLAPQSLEAGATLGGMYQILHEISRGAMGVVYRAEDLGLGRPVALKTLRPDLARDRIFVERFRTEAATLAALRHENLVQVHAFGVDGDNVYFVMELVEGEPLEDRIELARHEGRWMRLPEVASVISQIARALDAMHKAGILHRDVKPANILLDRVRDRAVLVDVGIAKRKGSAKDPAGTPGFTAPETFSGGAEGPSTDVYGLAATTYMLLTTNPPFGDDLVDNILRRQVSEPPRPPSSFNSVLTPEVDAVLLRALDPDPDKRYHSASELASALALALCEEQGVPSVLDSEITNVRLVLPPSARRREADDDSATITPVIAGVPPRPGQVVGDMRTLPGVRVDTPFQEIHSDVGQAMRQSARVAVFSPVVTIPRVLSHQSGSPVQRETEAPQTTVPHTRGVLFRSAYRVLGAKQGAAWVAQVSRKDPALAIALRPQNTLLSWHPTRAFVVMLHELTHVGRPREAFARELGRVATAATFSHFYGANPGALAPPSVMSAADLFWRRYHTWGVVTVEPQDEHGTHVLIDEGPADELVCASTAGIFEQVALLAGASQVKVEHVDCESTGAAECRFIVTWEIG
ncbi:MAG: diguanylate cyclase [Deltaproteobacteria bacterium]|nr:diguanylate cyclase [Deltaproteobacteria bacterium]